jgi:uncharacterized protein (TIGR02001 family)
VAVAGAAMWLGTVSLPAVALLALLTPAYGGEPAATDKDTADKSASDAFETTLGASLMSDYLYRGISLSHHGPSASSSIELEHNWFYVGGQIYSVRVPGDPLAELTGTGGIRHEMAGINFDLGAEAYYYPGETPAPGSGATTYWQSNLSASRRIMDAFEVTGKVAYSPSVWNSGAWGMYGSGELKFDLPKFKLAKEDVSWMLVGELGYQGYGTTSVGSQLPDYAHWRLGVIFEHDELSLELNYQDTNLNKESCFVLAGDTSSGLSGHRRFAANTLGLQSNLCSRTLVGTLSLEFEPPKP